MRPRTKIFAIGFAIGLLLATSINALPYAASYHAYEGDGYEVIGFPFTFRSMGGYVFTYQFRFGFLLADAMIGLAVAVVLGFACIWLLRGAFPPKRGFPVIPRGGNSAGE